MHINLNPLRVVGRDKTVYSAFRTKIQFIHEKVLICIISDGVISRKQNKMMHMKAKHTAILFNYQGKGITVVLLLMLFVRNVGVSF